MAFLTYSDETYRFAYAPEATFGTAITDDASFKEILFPKGVFVGSGVEMTDLDLNRASRLQNLADIHVDATSKGVEIVVPEMVVTKDRLADLLYACMQNRTTQGAATAYQKVYKMHASQPDFTASAGMFFTLAAYSPIAAKSYRVTSCIVKSLEIAAEKGTGPAVLVKVKNLTILGKKLVPGATLVPASWGAQGTSRFNSYAFTFTDITASNTAIPWMKFSCKLDNGARVNDLDSDGTPKTYFLDPPKMSAATVQVTHWYNADTAGTVRDFMAGHIAATAVQFKLETGTTGNDGFLSLAFTGVISENPQGSENRELTVPVSWICGNSGANDAVAITIADSISQT